MNKQASKHSSMYCVNNNDVDLGEKRIEIEVYEDCYIFVYE